MYRYSTGTYCEETGNRINYEVKTIYLNAHGKNRKDIPEELLEFLDYVKNTGRRKEISTADPFVRHLQNTIDTIKQDRSMEERYMLLEEMMRNEKQEGRQEIAVQFLLDSLNSKFSVSTALSKKISSETDMNKLQSWFQLSLKVTSLEDFEKNM